MENKRNSFNRQTEQFYDFWAKRDPSFSQDVPKPDSLYFFARCTALAPDMPVTIPAYCQSVQYAAGYIKYMFLGWVGMYSLLTDEQYDNFYEKGSFEDGVATLMDINEIIKSGKRKTAITDDIKKKFLEIINICDSVFETEDKKSCIEKLCNAVKLCNRYFYNERFEKEIGYVFYINFFDGISKAECYLKPYMINPHYHNVSKLISEEEWDESQTQYMDEFIASII